MVPIKESKNKNKAVLSQNGENILIVYQTG